MLGEGAPPADIAATRHAYGLDVPLGQQYLRYWKGVLHGDLGRSIRYAQPVSKLLVQRYPFTFELTLAALLIAIALSIPAGIYSA
jgi:peptide/nickel transport system permease protein